MNDPQNGMTYADAGVNIDTGNELVKHLAPLAQSTYRPEVLTGLGGFNGLFELDVHQYSKPVLVSGTDGVGTKLKIAIEMQKHDTIGIDLVAMCINDIAVIGAEPLFFLDYYATGELDLKQAPDVVKGIAYACRISGCSLLGGETAEMPGMYARYDYDLAGFCVGIVDKHQMVTGSDVSSGQVLIALGSNGIHANGFSLVRKILSHYQLDLNDKLFDQTIGEELLKPTRLYGHILPKLVGLYAITGIVHITGGGLTDNIPRILSDKLQARVDLSAWQWPAIFQWLQQKGNIDDDEMLKTFNCGVGIVLVAEADQKQQIIEYLHNQGETAWAIGDITTKNTQASNVIYQHD
jgi:phosphoribosylformylglycinamidine cyclo-ligase